MLKKWKESNCKIHSYLIKECACLYNPPYKLFKFPSILRNGEKREKWIGELDEKTKKKNSHLVIMTSFVVIILSMVSNCYTLIPRTKTRLSKADTTAEKRDNQAPRSTKES